MYNPEEDGKSQNAMYKDPNSDKSVESLVEQASRAVEQGLRSAYDVWLQLGADGTEATAPNQFGDIAMVADIESETAMLTSLRQFGEQSGVTITVHSEEHGVVTVGSETDKAQRPSMLAVIDGLDGSSVYKKDREHGQYGTMFALFENDDPLYNQYLAAGILLHNERSILLACQGQPLKAINIETGEVSYPQANSTAQLQTGNAVFADKATVSPEDPLQDYFAVNTAMAEALEARLGVVSVRSGSTAANIGAVATGQALLDLGATRKGNLEYATGYAVVTSAGGMVTTVTGEDIGTKRFLEFGQNQHEPVIVAASPAVAQQVVDAIKS